MQDFRAGKKELYRLYFIGLFFILAGHVYVIEPYFQLKYQEEQLQNSLTGLEASLEALSRQATDIKSIRETATRELAGIRKEVHHFPDTLRNALPRISETIENRRESGHRDAGRQQNVRQTWSAPSPAPFLPAEITTFGQGVQHYINSWFSELVTRLEKGVVSPITGLAPDLEVEGQTDLAALCRQAVARVRTRIEEIPADFWHSYDGPGGKVDVSFQVSDTIDLAFTPVEEKVQALLKRTEELRDKEAKELGDLKDHLDQTRREIKVLGERIKTLESPFGRIPLDLTDLIRLFPFLIVLLAVKLTLVLRQAAGQRTLLSASLPEEDDLIISEIRRYHLGGFLFAGASKAILIIWYLLLGGVFVRSFLLIAFPASEQTAGLAPGSTSLRLLYQGAGLAGITALLFFARLSLRSGRSGSGPSG